jgi:hypothetical protein
MELSGGAGVEVRQRQHRLMRFSGRSAMLHENHVPIHPRLAERAHQAGELIGRIRKLHWMGMHDEAEYLESSLCSLGNEQVLFAEASDTD